MDRLVWSPVLLLLLLLGAEVVRGQIDNDCFEDNGGCEHFCHNTDLSYYCTCETGYRIKEDLHSCLWLNCDHPGNITDGWLTETDDFNIESYAQFGCEDTTTHTLLGNELRRCNDFGEWVEWSGEQPLCHDECLVGMLEQFCASSGVSDSQCRQLGCCPSDFDSFCYFKNVWLYLRYSGLRPTENNGEGWDKVEHGTIKGCKLQCSMPGSQECRSYGMLDRGYEEQPEDTFVKLDDCHFLEKTRQQYENDGTLEEDDSFDFYDQIQTHQLLEHPPNVDYHNLGNLYAGCYNDQSGDRDLEHIGWSATDAHTTPSMCINECRKAGYRFAGLQDSHECWCGNGLIRKHGDSGAVCDSLCNGDSNQMCGGIFANSVYRVPFDARYIGCYNYEGFPIKLWDNDEDKSAIDCIDGCQDVNYQFAAVTDGGACYCKNTYGDGGVAEGELCDLQCGDAHWGEQNCGGAQQYAFYDTKLAFEIASPSGHYGVSTFYEDLTEATAITTMVFTHFPRMKSFISPRLVIHASEAVLTPEEASRCASDCYEPCDEIFHPEGISDQGIDVYLRFFYVNLADILQYTTPSTQRVFLYAQTVLVDQDVEFDFSLLVKTRQLVIDRNDDPWIYVSPVAAPIYVGELENEVLSFGPQTDITFVKQSMMCVRLLLQTQTIDNTNTAGSILNDIGKEHAFGEEDGAYLEGVRMATAEPVGIGRSGISFAPFYTQAYIEEILQLYSDRMTPYLTTYDAIKDDGTTDNDFVNHVQSMLQHYVAGNLHEATRSFHGVSSGVLRSDSTYYGIQARYDQSNAKLQVASDEFEQGIDGLDDPDWESALLGFTSGIRAMVNGLVRELDAEEIESELGALIDGISGLADAMQNIGDSMEKTVRVMSVLSNITEQLDDIGADVDYSKYMGDVEFLVTFDKNVERWISLKTLVNVIMTDPTVEEISGSGNYSSALMDISNWGEGFCRSQLELGQLLSEAFRQKRYVQSKLALVERYNGYLADLIEDITLRPLMLTQMKELEYEIRLDMNAVLFTYSQLYYFVNVVECNPIFGPDFGASLEQLLVKFNLALQDNIWVGPDAPLPVSAPIHIEDDDTSPGCNDAKLCPINYLRQNRIFFYEISIGQSELDRYEKFRVNEITVRFNGAEATEGNHYLRLSIESSGPLGKNYQGTSNVFVASATSLTYEYHIVSEFVSIRALPYYPFGDVIQHVTPYTTWIIGVNEPVSSDIDLSQVTSVDILFDGTASVPVN